MAESDPRQLEHVARAALARVLPEDRLSTDPSDLLAHARDAWPALAKWSQQDIRGAAPLAVVRPRSVAEVAAVLRAARSERLAVIPYGAGSGVVGGVVPQGPAISLDTRQLNGVVDFDAHDLTAAAWAGTPAMELELWLNDRGCTTGHYPQSLPLATVGGLVATRSSGTFSSRYGSIEDLVVGLQVVLADGSIIENKPVPRASTGPRLFDLFIGSEGTLGVITKVTLKIAPLPEVRRFRGVTFTGLEEGLEAVRAFFQLGVPPALIRLYDATEAEHLFEQTSAPAAGKSLLILGLEGPARMVQVHEDLVLETCARHGGADLGEEIGNAWERSRYDAFWLAQGNEGTRIADAIEVSALWNRLPRLYRSVTSALAPLVDACWAHFSHFYGQGGSIYFIVFASGSDARDALSRYHRIWATAMDEVLRAGASISHHHGIGRLRSQWLPAELGGYLGVLTNVKRALDPDGILNPGKLAVPRT